MKKIIGIFIIALLVNSCSLNPSWDVDGIAPIIKSRLTFNSIIGDNYLQTDSDSALRFVFEDTLYTLKIDTLSNNISINESSEVRWTFPSIVIQSFDPLLNAFKIRIPFNLGDARIHDVRIKNGKMNIEIKSVMTRGFKFRYHSQRVTKNGQPFEYLGYVPPATNGDTSIFRASLDMDDYEFDLRPISNTFYNTLELSTDVQFDSTGGPLPMVNNQLMFMSNVNISNLNLYFVKGYLGQYDFNLSDAKLDIDILRKFPEGTVNVDFVQADLQMMNYFGAEAQLYVSSLKALNTRTGTSANLTGSGIQQTINVNRANYSGSAAQPVTPSIYNLLLNSNNSNINQVLHILPDKLELNAKIKLNPLGNSAGYNDFYFPDYPTFVYGKITAPLRFSINQVKFVDTLSNPFLNFELGKSFLSGELRAKVLNKFPFAASAQIELIENSAVVQTISSATNIQAAPVNAQFRVESPIESNLKFELNELTFERLRNADKLIIKVQFETQPTSQLLKMYSDYFIDFKITSDIQFRIQL